MGEETKQTFDEQDFLNWLDSEEGQQWERSVDWDEVEENKRRRIAERNEY